MIMDPILTLKLITYVLLPSLGMGAIYWQYRSYKKIEAIAIRHIAGMSMADFHRARKNKTKGDEG